MAASPIKATDANVAASASHTVLEMKDIDASAPELTTSVLSRSALQQYFRKLAELLPATPRVQVRSPGSRCEACHAIQPVATAGRV